VKLDTESFSSLIKLIIFCVLTGGMTVILALTLSNGSFGGRDEYKAMFTDVTGVAKGDDVRIAGVSVGAVSGVEIVQKDKAVVTFTVDPETQVTQNTTATLRFRNLVGQRYMSLAQGSEGGTTRMKPGSTIPLERTQEALDLNLLLNGFKPVFEALNPEDTNKLAFEIVQTLQGEAGNVENLLSTTSSLTNTLAGRDKLIGDVVDNLSDVLDTIGSRDTELRTTIDTLVRFVGGLRKDRNAILDSIDSVSDLTEETADLLDDANPYLVEDIKQLRRLTKNLSKPANLNQMSDSIQILPIKLTKVSNLASNGSLFNFYICELDVDLEGPIPAPILNLLNPLLNLPLGGLERCATEPEEYP
jgi:phospholipid/cholesterol/gamma-HCH transport system substrate-binding protein